MASLSSAATPPCSALHGGILSSLSNAKYSQDLADRKLNLVLKHASSTQQDTVPATASPGRLLSWSSKACREALLPKLSSEHPLGSQRPPLTCPAGGAHAQAAQPQAASTSTSDLLGSARHQTAAATAAAALQRLQAAASCATPGAAPALVTAALGVVSLALLFAWRRAPPSLRSRALGFLKLAQLAQQQRGRHQAVATAGYPEVGQLVQQQGGQQQAEAGVGSRSSHVGLEGGLLQQQQQPGHHASVVDGEGGSGGLQREPRGGQQQVKAGAGSHLSHGGPEGGVQQLQQMARHASAVDSEGGSGGQQREVQADISSRSRCSAARPQQPQPGAGEDRPEQALHGTDRDPAAVAAPAVGTSRHATEVGPGSRQCSPHTRLACCAGHMRASCEFSLSPGDQQPLFLWSL